MKTKEKKADILAKIIHDIETPTNAQISALESFLTTSSQKINQEETDLIKLTLNSCLNVQKLIENFNCVHKLNFENLKLNYEKFNIIELVREAVKEADILLKYSGLKIDFKEEEDVIVCADKLQIQRVIDNILSNSINHAFKNSKIEINISKEKNYFIFKVKNNSPYLEPKVLNEFFEKFKTHSSSYNRTMVNLGLYLSKEIICAHFGKMIIYSYPNDINILGFSIPIK